MVNSIKQFEKKICTSEQICPMTSCCIKEIGTTKNFKILEIYWYISNAVMIVFCRYVRFHEQKIFLPVFRRHKVRITVKNKYEIISKEL